MTVKGYVLEPPRISASNSQYSSTPSVVVLDETAYLARFPEGSEPAPRVEYFVQVVPDGATGEDRFFYDAKFGWTKNEGVAATGNTPAKGFQRFDYDTTAQAFKLLPGSVLETLGTVGPTLNTTRLRVTPPMASMTDLPSAPYRLSYGGSGGGASLGVALVTTFTTPPVGVVQVHQVTGELNWNPADLVSLVDQPVRFQQQQFYGFQKSKGKIGPVSDADYPNPPSKGLLLNPLPATAQYPMVRFGFGLWLTPVEQPNDSALAAFTPASGTVAWSRTTGLLKFNAADLAAHSTDDIYYDGVFIGWGVSLPSQNLGTVSSPSALTDLPPEGGDIVFRVPPSGILPAHQFPSTSRVDTFSPQGTYGIVEILNATGAVSFSSTDVNLYGSRTVTAHKGDLPLEYGIGLRFYRSMVNPSATSSTPGDFALYYAAIGDDRGTLAKPITATPQVFLPALPIEDPSFPVTLLAEQGEGSYVGPISDMSGPNPTPGLGYLINYETRQLTYANRKAGVVTNLPVSVGATPLPDPLIMGTNYKFEMEVAPNSGSYYEMVEGEDYLIDPIPGVLTFTKVSGPVVGLGVTGTLSGTTFRDPSSSLGTLAGDLLYVMSGAYKGIYRLAGGDLSTGVAVDLDPSVAPNATDLQYEVHRNPEVVADRYWVPLAPSDPNTKVEKIRLLGNVGNETVIIGSSTGTFEDPRTLSDPSKDFIALGVGVGDTLVLTTGGDSGTAHIVTVVGQNSLQLATPVTDLSPSAKGYRVVRRLRLPIIDPVSRTRFRFGQTTYTTSSQTSLVLTDSAFTDPVILPSGSVEVSQETGNLNFSAADIPTLPATTSVYWVRRLVTAKDYRVQPSLGFIEFTDRFLTGEEALVTYIPLDSLGDPTEPTEERVTFGILKEVTYPTPRPSPTSVVSFNPMGRTVASNPAPVVYRGGRPQTVGQQCTVSTGASTITFLPDKGYMTDALPHGAVLGTDERIYVDYNVYEAMGGEKNVTLLNPMSVAQVILTEDATSFSVAGDATADFRPNTLLKVERDYVYRIASVTYPSPTDPTSTLVTLAIGETLAENLTDPKLYRVSGDVDATAFQPSYFLNEAAPFLNISRGMGSFRLYGDRTSVYRAGTVLLFTNSGPAYLDYYLVASSKFSDGWTEVTLTTNAQRQYAQGQAFLKYTVRPILSEGVTRGQTLRTPILTKPYGVFRRAAGQIGTLLSAPADYTLDNSGALDYKVALGDGEEIGIWYTGNTSTVPKANLRSTYTHGIVPNTMSDPNPNGLLGQILTISYTVLNPDSFYFRVETLTNFSEEVKQYLSNQARGSVPVSGPRLSNIVTSSFLYDQGRESVYFPERHIANQDLVARKYLKYLHDSVNHLEDALQSIDGRVVGADNGRFRYDGKDDNPARTSYDQVTNEIDDSFQVSPFPYRIVWNPFSVTYLGTYQRLYEAGSRSRLFPTYKANLFNLTVGGSDTPNTTTGTEILDFEQTGISTAPTVVSRRLPTALVVETAASGATTLYLDNSKGTETFLRPTFVSGMTLVVLNPDGTFRVPPANALTVSGVFDSPPRVTLAVGPTVSIPRGCTVRLCTSGPLQDTTYQKSYRVGTDLTLDLDGGTLRYVEPYWPFDGTVPLIPSALCINAPKSREALQMDGVGIRNVLTAPYRFPALDGLTENDSHDMGVPIATRTFDCEATYLDDDLNSVTDFLGRVTSDVTLSGITLDLTGTVLARVAGVWPAPTIQVADLVRFTTGPNATEGFRRVLTVLGNTLTVDVPFPFPSMGGESILVTAAPNVTTGTATFPNPTTISDPTGLPAASVGQTVIFTGAAHGNYKERRQIVAKPTADTATLDYPLPSTVGSSSYRVSNHISTYSDLSPLLASSESILGVVRDNDHLPPPKVDSQVLGIERFLDGDPVTGTDGVLTDLLSPASNVGTVMGTTLTGTGVNFVTAGINSSHFVYVRTGTNAGFYQVAFVPSSTTLTVSAPFPVDDTVTYRVVSSYGLLLEGLNDLFGVLRDAEAWALSTDAWQALLGSTVPVYVPPNTVSPNTYANDLRASDVSARTGATSARKTYLGTSPKPTERIGLTLGSRDLLYDKRYIWIDGRVNVRTGLVYLKDRAIGTRRKSLAQQRADLLRLLMME